MRIAAVSDDGMHVSEHFGRASYYVVLTVEDGQIANTETRPKAGHHTFAAQEHPTLAPGERHGYDAASEVKHRSMAGAITDCQALIAGGMGWGAFESLKAYGIEPVITDVRDIREAAVRYSQGSLPNLRERLH